MKKTFALQAPGKDDARVRDKIRHEVNKYLRRSRRKEPPEGFASWEFRCKVGPSAAAARDKPLKAVATEIDAVAGTGAKEVYIELIATPAQRRAAPES
jgi:hypothetical protein